MPQIGPPEIAVVLLVALLVFGPSRLPEVGQQAARGLREFRQFQANVRDDLKGMLDPDDEPDDGAVDPDDDFVPPDPPEPRRPRSTRPDAPPAPDAEATSPAEAPRPTPPDPRVRRLRPTPRGSRPRGPAARKTKAKAGPTAA